MNIEQVWEAVESGKTVYWHNKSYKVYIQEVTQNSFVTEYQTKHHTFKNGKVLSVRCISNYFGGLMDEKELSSLFVE
jgi:hypothetical protein